MYNSPLMLTHKQSSICIQQTGTRIKHKSSKQTQLIVRYLHHMQTFLGLMANLETCMLKLPSTPCCASQLLFTAGRSALPGRQIQFLILDPMSAIYKAVVITSLAVGQRCVMYRICIATSSFHYLVQYPTRNPGLQMQCSTYLVGLCDLDVLCYQVVIPDCVTGLFYQAVLPGCVSRCRNVLIIFCVLMTEPPETFSGLVHNILEQ